MDLIVETAYDPPYGARNSPKQRTGYLVGTVERWNDAKREELGDRVKHVTV